MHKVHSSFPLKIPTQFSSSTSTNLEFFPSRHPHLSLLPQNQMPLHEEKPKKLDHEVRDMVSAIMGRIPDLQKPGGSSLTSEEADDRGARIVTLAGHNIGATLKSEMDEKSGGPDEELDAMMSTYVNSNFQAVNNSIMMGGSYTTNDPGVHLDVSDFVEHRERDHAKPGKHGKKEKMKKKKKDQESEKSDQQTEHSD